MYVISYDMNSAAISRYNNEESKRQAAQEAADEFRLRHLRHDRGGKVKDVVVKPGSFQVMSDDSQYLASLPSKFRCYERDKVRQEGTQE